MTTVIHCLTNTANSQQYCQSTQVLGKIVLVTANLQKAINLALYLMLVLLVSCWLPSASTTSIDNRALAVLLLAVGSFFIHCVCEEGICRFYCPAPKVFVQVMGRESLQEASICAVSIQSLTKQVIAICNEIKCFLLR